MKRIVKEDDDIKIWIFSDERHLERVVLDSGYRNMGMVIARCGNMANGRFRIHHIRVLNQTREWYGIYTKSGKKIS